MPLETVTFVQDLVVANPPGTDAILQGDDHIRLIKTALDNTFPNADKAFYIPDALSKAVDYTILAADMNKFLYVDASGAARAQTLPALAAANDGWSIFIQKADSSANAVTVVGTINGVANLVLGTQWASALVYWDGTAWKAIVFQTATAQLAELTAPASGDFLPIYDVSAVANLKITLANVLKVINDLAAETIPAADDKLVIYDTSGSDANGMTLANLFKTTNVLTEDTAPDPAVDFILSFDTSGLVAAKIKLAVVNPFSSQLLHVQDQKAAGTDGGTFTSGAWRTRTLNTSVTNEISGASLAANQITLPAGTYFIDASAPAAIGNLDSAAEHKVKLRNVTDASDTLIGTTERIEGDNSPDIRSQTRSFVKGRFTIAAEKVFELQHQTSNSMTTTGLGFAADFSVVEIYADVLIWKVL